jgi:hypothetical protein
MLKSLISKIKSEKSDAHSSKNSASKEEQPYNKPVINK